MLPYVCLHASSSLLHVLSLLLFYSFRSLNNQPRYSPQPMSLCIYSSTSHHFPNKVGDKAHSSSPVLCPVGGVPVTTVFPGHLQVEQKSLHKLCTNLSSVTGDPCTQVWATGLNEKPEYCRGGSHNSLHFRCLLSDSTCVTAVSQWITGHWIVCFWMSKRLVQDGQFWLQGQFMSRDQMLILY